MSDDDITNSSSSNSDGRSNINERRQTSSLKNVDELWMNERMSDYELNKKNKCNNNTTQSLFVRIFRSFFLSFSISSCENAIKNIQTSLAYTYIRETHPIKIHLDVRRVHKCIWFQSNLILCALNTHYEVFCVHKHTHTYARPFAVYVVFHTHSDFKFMRMWLKCKTLSVNHMRHCAHKFSINFKMIAYISIYRYNERKAEKQRMSR